MSSVATEKSNEDLTKSKNNANDSEKSTVYDDVSPLAKCKKTFLRNQRFKTKKSEHTILQKMGVEKSSVTREVRMKAMF